ncbi:MAG: hypothetical protein ACTSR2_02145 [Candidatus Hodarchaeales archaeon]
MALSRDQIILNLINIKAQLRDERLRQRRLMKKLQESREKFKELLKKEERLKKQLSDARYYDRKKSLEKKQEKVIRGG